VPKKNEINETKGKRTEYENTYNKVWAIRSPGDSSKFSLACCRTSREFGLYNLPSRTLSIPLNEWLATFLRLIAPHGRKTTHSRTSTVHILIFRSPRGQRWMQPHQKRRLRWLLSKNLSSTGFTVQWSQTSAKVRG